MAGLYVLSGREAGPFADLPDDGEAGTYKDVIKAVTEHYWVSFWLLLWVCERVRLSCVFCRVASRKRESFVLDSVRLLCFSFGADVVIVGMTEHPELAKKRNFDCATSEKCVAFWLPFVHDRNTGSCTISCTAAAISSKKILVWKMARAATARAMVCFACCCVLMLV